MIAVAKLKSESGLNLIETNIPKISDDEVLIKVKAASICGTDIHIFNWDHPWTERVKPPRTVGHEFAGEVVEAGKDVRKISVDEYVSAESHIFCDNCPTCKSGNRHVCDNMKFLGVDVDGCFAEYVKIPERNVWKNNKQLPPKIATLQESMGNSVYTVSSVNVKDKSVAIFGMGPTGLFAVGIAKAFGAKTVIGIDGKNFRLDIAKKMGADSTINRREKDVVKEILSSVGTVDVILEMAGTQSAIEQGLKVLKVGGQAAFLGLPSEKIVLDWSKDFVFKNVKAIGIYGRLVWNTWKLTSDLLYSGKVDVRPMITHQIKLEEFEKGIEAMKSGNSGKVVMLI